MRQRDDLAFPMLEYERRLHELRQRMEQRDIEVMLTTTPENITYLTGFESPGHWYFQGLLVPLEGEPVMVPRLSEDTGVQALSWIEISRAYQDFEHPMDILRDTLLEFDFHNKRTGYEKDCWFFTAAQQERLFASCPATNFIDCSGIIEEARLVKSDFEVEMIRKAARTAEAGMRAGIEAVEAGVTENDIAAEILYAMTKAGSEWPSIVPFVASGERGAIVHATWAGRTIQPGDIILLEVGGCLKRYHAAMMRTGFVGEPNKQAREAEKVVQEAVNLALETIKPGLTAGQVDAVSRQFIAKSSFGGVQASRSAYSIGIAVPPDWGEGHILSMQPNNPHVLQTNMVFHLLPWVQIPGKGGVSFSETIRVTQDGCETLTNFERKLFVK
jgi:Xaa-Pro dipeptidase